MIDRNDWFKLSSLQHSADRLSERIPHAASCPVYDRAISITKLEHLASHFTSECYSGTHVLTSIDGWVIQCGSRSTRPKYMNGLRLTSS